MAMKNLRLSNVSRSFGSVVALDNLNLEIGSGELVALLGPSGCGKTTALRIIAGLEAMDSGSISLGTEDISNIPAHKRNMGMVFQAYSLFPHLTVEDNVTFGLQMRKTSREIQKNRAQELLEIIGLPTLAKRRAHELSGGQQQRVALARALAYSPEILLLDEPLSALDAQVRMNLREEIRRLQISLGTTTLFVTHDQEEAMSIADRVGVMNHGKLEQIDKPIKLYNDPATPFVASFVGLTNRISAEVTQSRKAKILKQKIAISETSGGFKEGELVNAIVRPESLVLAPDSDPEAAQGLVALKSFLGPITKIGISVEGFPLLNLEISSKEVRKLEIGDRISFKLHLDEVMVERV